MANGIVPAALPPVDGTCHHKCVPVVRQRAERRLKFLARPLVIPKTMVSVGAGGQMYDARPGLELLGFLQGNARLFATGLRVVDALPIEIAMHSAQ